MHVETIPVNADGFFMDFMMNAYVASANEKANSVVIVDPGGQGQKIMEAVGPRSVAAILLTHYHPDHVGALCSLRDVWDETSVPVYIHALDRDSLTGEKAWSRDKTGCGPALEKAFVTLKDGDVVTDAGLSLKVMHTPGHSKGGLCYYDQQDGVLFSGDTIFRGTTGRTDLGTGKAQDMHNTLQILAQLPDETVVLPGHEEPTTIAHERTRSLIEY